MNFQQPEKIHTDSKLSVHSIFYTIQGEGVFCGTPAIFIRLAGCNLQCPLCDTDYTSNRIGMDEFEIVKRCKALSSNGLVVITGGEPFRQNTECLIRLLVENGYYVQVETNGTLPPPNLIFSKDIVARSGVYIVCSPKTGSINKEIEKVCCCFKYVISHNSIDPVDKLPIYVLGSSVKVYRPLNTINNLIYVQPADHSDKEENSKNIKAAIEACMQKQYILQLQIHKILEVP